MDDVRGFKGSFRENYDYYKYIVPNRLTIIDKITEIIKSETVNLTENITVVDIGCGSGGACKTILEGATNINMIAIDDKSFMLNQARRQLADLVDDGKLSFMQCDILSALKEIESESVSFAVSFYLLHNYHEKDRKDIYREIYRILKPGGVFFNGDLYAWDDPVMNTKLTQERAKFCINSLIALDRVEYVSKFVMHLINDQSRDIIMVESEAIVNIKDTGFRDVKVLFRAKSEALLEAKR
ncbi:MAG: class I SAM-dependent methyltransferase [bacterium]|nr:class I SAM-dependent methyltransferase [bacterium]